MTRPMLRALALLAPLAVVGCTVVPPSGPTAIALPKQGEDFSVFRAHDADCKDYASSQIGYGAQANQATRSAVGSAALGTALGAAAGAAIGSVSGNMGAGAAVGAAGGLLVGSAVGANQAQDSAGNLQYRYDTAYTQCMVAHGYKVEQRPRVVAYPAYEPYPYGYAYPYPYSYPYPYPYGYRSYRRW